MAARKDLPADYAVDALALEAYRLEKQNARPYSYGKLVADTTLEEREKIAEEYRSRRRTGRRMSFLPPGAGVQRDLERIRKKHARQEEE